MNSVTAREEELESTILSVSFLALIGYVILMVGSFLNSSWLGVWSGVFFIWCLFRTSSNGLGKAYFERKKNEKKS